MAWPNRNDPNYHEFVDAYNARRRARRADPEYRAKEREAMRERARKRAAKKEQGGDRKG